MKLFNDHDHNDTMDMIDTLIIENSIYDDEHKGEVSKKRATLNKDYGRIGIAISDERASNSDGAPEYLEPDDDGNIPGIDPRIPMMG